ncbi:MAG: hypothetical protein WAT71_02905 [Ignavibacteria bacterium]
MEISELKRNLRKKIDDINDASLLKEVEVVINIISKDKEDFTDLSDELKESILEGLAQLDKGEKITYEEVMKRNKRWFMK